MTLPTDPEKRELRLAKFGDDINRLANFIRDNHPEQVEAGGEAVDIAIRVMKTQAEKLKNG